MSPKQAATDAYFDATADGPFDHQRDAYEAGFEDGGAYERLAERERIRQGVIEVFAKFEYDLVFTAPELYSMRVQQVKDRVAELLDGDS